MSKRDLNDMPARHAPAPGQPSPGGDDGLFAGGPPLRLQLKYRLIKPGEWRVFARTVLFVLLAWVPLLLLTAVEGTLHRGGELGSFLLDFGALARYAIAGPLLIVAEAVCISALGTIAGRFVETGIVDDADRHRLAGAEALVRRLRDAPLVEAAVAAIALAVSAAAIHAYPLSVLPLWHRSADGATLSIAGWWASLVSAPLLLMLLLGWLWRLLLWTYFLASVARMRLRLVPVHPDRAAGLGFVGYSVRAFSLVGAALGTIVAGTVANRVVHDAVPLTDFRYPIAALVLVVVALCTAPLLAFSSRLLAEWWRGVCDYGALASAFGRRFEREWFGARRHQYDDLLERPDFSAATDLYQVVDRVHDLRIVPVDLVSVLSLAGATLLPFVPVVLAALPLDEVLGALAGLLR